MYAKVYNFKFPGLSEAKVAATFCSENLGKKIVPFNIRSLSISIGKCGSISINLKFEGGKMTSLVGHSGSGKSTILNLIPRFYDAKSGDIIIDDQSIYDSTIESLRSEISMVSQETTLFDDTIKNNIKYGRQEATDEEVFKVSKLSYCDEFINSLPNKFDTLIGENGVRLSGGEKQRVSIARALVKKPLVILADEPTGNLDPNVSDEILDLLEIATDSGAAVLMSTHNFPLIQPRKKRFIELNEGRLVFQ